MLTPTPRTSATETFSRPTPAMFAHFNSARDTAEMPRADASTPRPQPTASPDDWTRECLFDCYND